MPLQQGTTTRDGERVGFYRWGDDGKMYVYEQGNPEDREDAKDKALEQGKAIESSKHS